MATVRFSTLHVGDAFYDTHGVLHIVEPLVKTGCCSGKSNASIVGTFEKSYFHPMKHVTLTTKYKTHPNNVEALQEYIGRPIVIEADENMYEKAFWAEYVRPTVSHPLIEFEETDTWLIHFGQGEKIHKRHYQKFNGKDWEGYEF